MIEGHEIFFIKKFAVFAIPRSIVLSEADRKVEEKYFKLLTDFLDTSGFYYSPTYDLSNSCQRQAELKEKKMACEKEFGPARALSMFFDRRFFWNKYVATDFISRGLDSWFVPVIDGFIRMERLTLRETTFDFLLISRRGCKRSGARFLTRGADPLGNVANFVETEQVVHLKGVTSSYVQSRGSIPLLWTQRARSVKDIKPAPTVLNSVCQRMAFLRHIEMQTVAYLEQVMVNLIDQKGGEEAVGEAFETQSFLASRPNLKYIAFDFHEVCKGNRYENLDKLLQKVQGELKKYSYFLKDGTGNVVMSQTGGIRTNCIDCLDRTNVVQSVFARFMLMAQLQNIGILSGEGFFF